MLPRRVLALVPLVLVALAPSAPAQEPKPAAPVAPLAPVAPATSALQATTIRSSEDVALALDRLDRLATLEKLGALGAPQALAEFRAALLASLSSVVVTGTLEDVPLSEALDAVLKAVGKAGGRVSVVLSPADREALACLRVSATFHGARDVDAVRSLLRLHESARDQDQAFVEWSEDAGVFVVRATRLDLDPDPDPAERGLVLDPFQGPELPAPIGPRAWLGVTWVDQNPRGPGAGGVRVTQVLPGSPAETAGIQAGDLITSFGEDGEDDPAVLAGDDLRQRIAGHAPGDVVIVELLREGARRKVSLVLGVAPGQ